MIKTVALNTGEDALELNVEMLHWAIKEGLPLAARFHAYNAVMYAKIVYPDLKEGKPSSE